MIALRQAGTRDFRLSYDERVTGDARYMTIRIPMPSSASQMRTGILATPEESAYYAFWDEEFDRRYEESKALDRALMADELAARDPDGHVTVERAS